jgi:hypothetical protein
MTNYKFNTQTELTKWAYSECNEDKMKTIILIAEHLKARTAPMKDEKYEELSAQGDRGFVNYAKIKYREMFRVRKTSSKPKEEIVLKSVI